jgi:mannitol-1-phosphate/altronate dehydrogenase
MNVPSQKSCPDDINSANEKNETTTKGSIHFPFAALTFPRVNNTNKYHQMSLTVNTRRGTLPKLFRQSSRYTWWAQESARDFNSILYSNYFEVLSAQAATALFLR